MKKHGILNSKLAACIAALGHKDLFMIGDAGMPIPPGIEIIDLAVCAGVPDFKSVTDAILEETCIEKCYLAEEIKEANPTLHQYLQTKLGTIPWEYKSHEELKQHSQKVRFAVRTGEFSPYPNIILEAGVAF